MSHIRDEADKSFEALREAIAIGERARIPVQISHIKLGTVGVWHKAAEAIALIEARAQARRRRHRRRVSVQRVELDDHGARARQALRRSAERRARRSPTSAAPANVLIVRHAAHPEYEFKTLDAVADERRA